MPSYDDPYDPKALRRIRFYVYLLPVIGVVPAGWRLAQRQGDRQERMICRMAVTLGLCWLLFYLLSGTGAHNTQSLWLWIVNTMTTSSYFLINFWLMLRVWQRKSVHLPGVSELSDRLP